MLMILQKKILFTITPFENTAERLHKAGVPVNKRPIPIENRDVCLELWVKNNIPLPKMRSDWLAINITLPPCLILKYSLRTTGGSNHPT